MNKIDISFDKNLDYILELKGELEGAKQLMHYGDELSKYRSANYLLSSYLTKYNNLSENAKKHLNVDVNELERIAVKVLVDQGHSDIVKKELLKKYGYSSSITKRFRQNTNTK